METFEIPRGVLDGIYSQQLIEENQEETRSPEQIIVDICNKERGNLTGYDCPECLNRGYFVRLSENGYRVNVECKCMEIRRSQKRMRESGLEDMVTRYTFDNYKSKETWQAKSLETAKKYAENPSGWFVAFGSPGTGKTHLCTAICGELLNRGMPTRYMLWMDDSKKIKSNLTDSEEYQRMVQPLKTCKVLYIDDLFKVGKGQEPSSADVSLAFEILNYRYNDSKLITILSSQVLLESILDIDEAVGSRIYERCKGNYLRLEGKPNWRLSH